MKFYSVNTQNLIDNINYISDKAGNVTVYGVIKGDGYGIGAVNMAKILSENGISCFAVSDMEDARKLRQAGFSQPILFMSALTNTDEITELLNLNLIATVGSTQFAEILSSTAKAIGINGSAHIKIDTGMGRYGFLPSQINQISELYSLDNIDFTGIYTHFYKSSNTKTTKKQFALFEKAVDELQRNNINVGTVHCCNSSAFLKYPEMYCDAVRIGSAFLGRTNVNDGNLKRIGICKAQIQEIKILPSKHTVGYGAGYITKKKTEIAIISVGYINGFSLDRGYDLWRLRDCLRGAARYIKAFIIRKRLYVEINGAKCAILGHVGMSNLVVDITNCNCKIGDYAELEINPLLLKDISVKFE